jgi:hypothetical protein
VLQLDPKSNEKVVDDIWRWLLKVWFSKAKKKGKSSKIEVSALYQNSCGGAVPLHLVATLLMALPHPAGVIRHPLLDKPVDDTLFSTLRELYKRSRRESDNVELHINVALSRRQLHKPIQFELCAKKDIQKGLVVCMYGGKPLDAQAVRNAEIPASTSHACTIKGPTGLFVADGLPYAMMIRRPVPGDEAGLQAIVRAGIEPLLPSEVRDGYSRVEIEAFESTPLGFMANCAVAEDPNMELSWLSINEGLTELPQLKAKRDIKHGEPLTWNYNNTDRKKLMCLFQEAHCDQCSGEHSSDDNPIIMCEMRDCISGRHWDCWIGDRPPLESKALEEYRHRCIEHPARQLRTPAAAAAAPPAPPQHNLPLQRSLPDPSDVSAPVADGPVAMDTHDDDCAATPAAAAPAAAPVPAPAADAEAHMQVYLPPLDWMKGLKWNCDQLHVEARASTLRDAGNGLFATQDFAAKDVIGWFWGKFVTKQDWQALVDGRLADTHGIFHPEEEDYRAETRMGVWRCIDPGIDLDTHDECRMLVSRQCPMGLINDPEETGRVNVEILPRSDWIVDGTGNTSWKMLPLIATQTIKQDDELFIDYGWEAKAWREMRRRAKTHADELKQRAASLAAQL